MGKFIISILLIVSCSNLLAQEGDRLKLDSLVKLINQLESEIKIKSDRLSSLKTDLNSLRIKINMANSNPSGEYPFSIKATSSQEGDLHDSSYFLSDKIATINKNEEIVLLDTIGYYWLIKYKDYIGYLNWYSIKYSREYLRYAKGEIDIETLNLNTPTKEQIEFSNIKREEEKKIAKEKKKEQALKRKKEKRAMLINNYGLIIANKIRNGDIWIGMTSQMARYSMGSPKEVNRSVGSWGTHEQWVYSSKYLYFENGTLTSWQD